MHPGRWRNKLKDVDNETHDLTSWVERDGNWVILHVESDPDSVSDLLGRLAPLRKLGFTVELACEESSSSSDDEEIEVESAKTCADHLAGRKCRHKLPCK